MSGTQATLARRIKSAYHRAPATPAGGRVCNTRYHVQREIRREVPLPGLVAGNTLKPWQPCTSDEAAQDSSTYSRASHDSIYIGQTASLATRWHPIAIRLLKKHGANCICISAGKSRSTRIGHRRSLIALHSTPVTSGRGSKHFDAASSRFPAQVSSHKSQVKVSSKLLVP